MIFKQIGPSEIAQHGAWIFLSSHFHDLIQGHFMLAARGNEAGALSDFVWLYTGSVIFMVKFPVIFFHCMNYRYFMIGTA